MFIGSYVPNWNGPVVVRDMLECCGHYTEGQTGNVDCSYNGSRNLADITLLIGYIYKIIQLPSVYGLCCPENANIDGDVNGKINLADVTMLIDHVYITKEETSACQ